MKAKLLKKVRAKVTLQERNKHYYLFLRGKLLYSGENLMDAKCMYRLQIIGLAEDIFKIRLKKKLL